MVDPFSPHMEAVARHFCGEPNAALSSRDELRFGEHGSMSVDIAKGTFFDHENKVGGGVIDLVKREARLEGREAVRYLQERVGAKLELDEAPKPRAKAEIKATYDYFDEHGELLFQVVRYEPKTFRQRRPDPKASDGWNWSVRGVRQIPYRLPELIEALGQGRTVYVVEGEKDADALWRRGVPATCNAGGAGKWPSEFAPFFAGADVVIVPDNDDAGRSHKEVVAASLAPVAGRVRVLDLPGLPPKGDVSDWLVENSGDVLLEITPIMSTVWGPAPPPSRFGAIHWGDLDRVAMRQDWLIQDMLFCGDAGLMFGASGSGKSFLTVELGLSVARGVPFLGKATRKGGVIYQAGEGGKGLVKRLRAYKQTHSVIADVPFILLPSRADFFGQDGDQEAFIQECQAQAASLSEPLSLIVIDTLSTASPGANENASEDMSRLLRFSEQLQKSTQAAVLWVHHKNAAGDRERGHTSLRANVDTALEVIRDDETNLRTLRVVKLKDGEDGEKIGFELQSVQIGTYDDGKPMTSCVVRPAQVGDAQTGQQKTRLPTGQSFFLKVLDSAISQYGARLPPLPEIPTNMDGVEYERFRQIYGATSFKSDANVIRQSVHREGSALISAGLIGRHDHWLWITDRGRRALR